jgi:hypothetical protein
MNTIAILLCLYHNTDKTKIIFQLSPGFEEYPLDVAGLIIEYIVDELDTSGSPLII